MPNTGSLRFGFTNLIQTATLKNGTGGGAPARDEVSPWVMENAQNKDRTYVWQQSSGGGTVNVDFLLASTGSPIWFALLGHRGAPSSTVGIASVTVKHQTGVYTPGGAFTMDGTITMGSGVRDGILILGNAVSADTIRFVLTVTSAFTLGRFFAGAVDLDLGKISSPGRERIMLKPMLENVVGSNPTKTRVGDNYCTITLPYNSEDRPTLDNLRTIAGKDDPFLMVDFDGTPYEAVIEDNQIQELLQWDVPELYDVKLKLRTLG